MSKQPVSNNPLSAANSQQFILPEQKRRLMSYCIDSFNVLLFLDASACLLLNRYKYVELGIHVVFRDWPSCPLNFLITSPVATSQRKAERSPPQLANLALSLVMHTSFTSWLCEPLYSLIAKPLKGFQSIADLSCDALIQYFPFTVNLTFKTGPRWPFRIRTHSGSIISIYPVEYLSCFCLCFCFCMWTDRYNE